jgi:hypothetical protein
MTDEETGFFDLNTNLTDEEIGFLDLTTNG